MSDRIRVKVKSTPRVLVNQSNIKTLSLGDLVDVDMSAGKTDGSLLIYDAAVAKFTPSTLLNKQNINGGNF